jgi:methyltransferase (TIGR00027 family)
MKQNQSSVTAQGIAVVRALESEKPEGVRICFDPLARRFIIGALYHFMRVFVTTGYAEWRGSGILGFLVARTRYIDDYLQACLDDGIGQLVILGAGLDSRPYRFEQLKERVCVFEADHPATQKVKLEKLKAVLGKIPEHVPSSRSTSR